MLAQLGRIRVRILLVNLAVLLVPVVGLEFARIYERELLSSLERDMRNQAALAREMVETGLADGRPLDDPAWAHTLTAAARQTRTRIRILDGRGAPVVDSHENGPPEGPEPPPPTILPQSAYDTARSVSTRPDDTADTSMSPERVEMWSTRSLPEEVWPIVPDRREVRAALAGHPDAYTRIRGRAPGVFLFISEPIRRGGEVVGVVYVTRSTSPVLAELYKIRTGLIEVLVVALVLTLLLTLVLAWSISRPLSKLSRAARRIAAGERRVEVPVGGSGEIRELGEAFARMTEKLDSRMRYISEFSADVAHELKSPLTSIRGAAELLGEGAADDPEARARFLANIELDVERLDRLVMRLLELSRIDSSVEPLEELDLGALIDRVVARTDTPEKPVVVTWHTPLRRWSGREEDLERALLNLVENGLRFSPEGLPVEIHVRQVPEAQLGIEVRDHGPGVPEANRAKIFERFFTTDADRTGTGLGLAIVKSVAAAHDGSIVLESPEDGGACFRMTLGPIRRRA
ncbi:MAG: HAMP domain-containing protein [Sandaracinaceae bacterium]|nr:HAMP domain-containing protein [Sandaracinaceae bacterium]